MAHGLLRYAAAFRRKIPAVLTRSYNRVKPAIQAGTPVKTGHMRDNLVGTADVAEIETDYFLAWRPQEFLGVVNPAGQIIQEFYPPIVLARVDPLTPAIEAERPLLAAEVAKAAAEAAREVGR